MPRPHPHKEDAESSDVWHFTYDTMRIHLVNYAHRGFREAQRHNGMTALSIGGVDRVHALGFEDLPRPFRERNSTILRAPQAAGWWVWKPEAMLVALARLAEDDVLVYSDCGQEFVGDVRQFLPLFETHGQGFVLFASAGEAAHTLASHTKRRVLDHYGIAPASEHGQHPMVCGNFLMMRNTDEVRAFLRQWSDGMTLDPAGRMVDRRLHCPLPEYPQQQGNKNDMGPLTALVALHGYHVGTFDAKTKVLQRAVGPRRRR